MMLKPINNVYILHDTSTGLRKLIIAESLEDAKSNYTMALDNPDIELYQASNQDLHNHYLD